MADIDPHTLRFAARKSRPQYRGAPPHIRLITARLREGCTEADLRKVIHYAASPKADGGLGWADDEKMRHCLRPETLFGSRQPRLSGFD